MTVHNTDTLPTRNDARNVTLKASGLAGFWDFTGDFNHQRVNDALALVGMGHLAPKVRTDLAALKDALTGAHPTRGHTGHAIVTVKDGYAVIQQVTDPVTREVEKPVNVCRAWLERDMQTGAMNLRVEDCLNPANSAALHGDIQKRADAAKTRVDSSSVSEALVAVTQEWCGLSLRAKGGVYWLPADAVEKWNALADAIEGASENHAAVYSMTTAGDARTVRSIVAAFVREADAKMAKVEERLASGEITAEQAQREAREMIDLAALAEHYETTLDTSLASIKERIGEVQYRAAQVTGLTLALDVQEAGEADAPVAA